MKNLRNFRIIVALLFFAGCLCYLLLSPVFFKPAAIVERVQIFPSAIAVSIGATLVWLVMTFMFGRVYCSTVCPVGMLQDIGRRTGIFLKIRSKTGFREGSKYGWRIQIFWVYVICLVAGVGGVAALLEPWDVMREICYAIRPSAGESYWLTLGVGSAVGIIGGIVALLLCLICGMLWGRDLCNMVCPIGTALGAVAPYAIYHIEIDPDRCTNCMRCEEVCRAHAVKVISRYVDNGRCVRCFDCVAECKDDAIRYQPNRNRPATPLLRRTRRAH